MYDEDCHLWRIIDVTNIMLLLTLRLGHAIAQAVSRLHPGAGAIPSQVMCDL